MLIDFIFIERKSNDILEALKSARIFRKHVVIQAREAFEGEVISTIMSDGFTETANTAQKGDMIIKNPDGEEYIVPHVKFFKLYEKAEKEGFYQSIGYCKAITNPFGKKIKIEAEWGEDQFGDESCLIADSCDQFGNNVGEPYIIELSAFRNTYIPM